jgi:VWFA-related protein
MSFSGQPCWPRGYTGCLTVSALHLHFLSLVSPLGACLAAIPLAAQSTAANTSNQTPTLRTSAQAVAVDVVVTRANDEPVLSLRAQEFQILEDGKPQAIDRFEEHSAPAGAAALTPLQLPPHEFTNRPIAPQGDSVNVLLLDSLNTPEADQAFVHNQLADFIRNNQPGTRVAIYSLNARLRLVQGFTADSSLLRAALDSNGATPGTTTVSRTRDDDLRDKEDLSILGAMSNTGGADAGMAVKSVAHSLEEQSSAQAGQRSTITLAALEQLARALAAIPGRKNLIWFASSFPVSIFPDGDKQQTQANGKEIGAAVRQTADLLTQAKVAVYPVSAQGIILDRTTNADSGGQPSGDDFERNPNHGAAANAANTAAMEQLAHDTGGEALYISNNLSQSVARAIQDGSHYYTLIYTPPSTRMDGKFHSIEVRLTAGKARLAYRRGYYADEAREEKARAGGRAAADPLPSLMAPGLPASTQILYQTRALPLTPQPAAGDPRAGGNAKLSGALTRYKVDVVIDPATLSLELAPDLTHNGKIEVALVAYDQAGKPVNWTGQTLALVLNPNSYAQVQRVGIPVHLQIDLPQGALSLSTGVYDLTAHKAGTLEIAIAAQSGAAP